jgi:hypothetical protein
MKDYLVRTFDNKMEYRSTCIRKGGNYYKRESDVIKIIVHGKSKWLERDHADVLYDIDMKKYVHIDYRKQYTVKGVAGNLTSDNFDCSWREVHQSDGLGIRLFATKAYVKNLTRDPSSGIYYDKEGGKKPRVGNSIMYNNIHYSYERQGYLFEKFKETNTNPLNALNTKYSYGVELETSHGIVPADTLLDLGILPVRDGSTPNYEYVTTPLKKIGSLLPIVKAIRKHCKFDISTSLHCHIGNVPTDRKFVLTFYKFMQTIQNDVFKMFPKYKADNDLGIKRRNYTMKLPVKKTVGGILNFLNNGQSMDDCYRGKMLDHSADVGRQRKWQLSARYHWVNLIPLIFYPSRTIEFRIHQGTLNQYKIMYWLLMCMAFVKYVELHGSSDHVSIGTILNAAYPEGNVAEALMLHYEDMCTYYQNYNEQNDTGYRQDVKDDLTYEPRIKLF